MSPTSRRDAVKKLREILEELTAVLSSGADPFAVNLREILDRLNEVLPQLSNEELPLDAEIIRYAAQIVKRQEEWVAGRTSLLALAPFIAILKLASMTKDELVRDFLGAWTPIVSLDRMTVGDLMLGMEYLGAKRLQTLQIPELPQIEYKPYEPISEDLRAALEAILAELKSTLEEMGRVPYDDFTRGDALRGYAVALALQENKASLNIDPLTEKIYIVKPREGTVESVVITFEGKRDAKNQKAG